MSIRTQIYLHDSQRKRVDEHIQATGKSLASIVRDALDLYFAHGNQDAQTALNATFGVAARVEVPSRSEWKNRGERIG